MEKRVGMLMKRFGLASVIAIVLGMVLIGLAGPAAGLALSWPGDPTPDEIVVRTPAVSPEMPTVTPVSPDSLLLTTTEVIVDDQDFNMQLYGPSGGWQHSGYGDTTYNGHAYWTYCTDTWEGSSVNNWAIWNPNLPASGQWEVFAFVPYVYTGRPDTTQARYEVHSASGDTTVEISHDRGTAEWVSLGTFNFDAGTGGYVTLRDVTPDWGYPGYHKTVKFDAMKWVFSSGGTGLTIISASTSVTPLYVGDTFCVNATVKNTGDVPVFTYNVVEAEFDPDDAVGMEGEQCQCLAYFRLDPGESAGTTALCCCPGSAWFRALEAGSVRCTVTAWWGTEEGSDPFSGEESTKTFTFYIESEAADIKFIASVIDAPAPYDILAMVEEVLEDPTGRLEPEDKVWIDAWGYDMPGSQVDWPLQSGDRIEVYGQVGFLDDPDPSGAVAWVGVGPLPHYLTKLPSGCPPDLVVFAPQVDGCTVTINGVVTSPCGDPVQRVNWDWGDEASNDSSFPASHTYAQSGTYVVVVTAYSAAGYTATDTKIVNANCGLPDLTVSELYWIPEEPNLQEPVTFCVVVKNEGAASSSCDLRLDLGQVFSQTKRVTGLAAGESTRMDFHYDPDGTSYSRGAIRAVIDSSEEITESNEDNNTREDLLVDHIGKIRKLIAEDGVEDGDRFFIYGICNAKVTLGPFVLAIGLLGNSPREQFYIEEGYFPFLPRINVPPSIPQPDIGDIVVYMVTYVETDIAFDVAFNVGIFLEPQDFISIKRVSQERPTGTISTEGVVTEVRQHGGATYVRLALGGTQQYGVWVEVPDGEKIPIKNSLVFVRGVGTLNWSNPIDTYIVETQEFQMVWGFHDDLTTLTVACPINTSISDQYGRIVSDDGTNQIPNAEVIVANHAKMFYLPADLTYSVEMDAYDTGTFDFTRASPIGEGISITGFEDVSVIASTKAFVEIVPNDTNYAMSIDYDGDEVVDYTRPPDSTTTVTSLAPQSGWNLISLPLVPADTSIESVLSSIYGEYDLIYAYDGCDVGDPWKRYDVNAPPYANDLTNLDEKRGIWIRVTDTSTLTVLGQVSSRTDIQLCEGWNLVGYPSTKTKAITDALSSIGGKYTLVYAYDALDTADPWKKYDVSAPPYANDLTEMQPGLAYWIKVSKDCVLTISN